MMSTHCTLQHSTPHCRAESDCKSWAEIPPTLNLFCLKAARQQHSINLDQISTQLWKTELCVTELCNSSNRTAHPLMPGISLPCCRSQNKG